MGWHVFVLALVAKRGGQAIRKSANSWAHSAIANPQISYVCQSAELNNFHINLQIANPKSRL
jgi:hypothetical protein